MERGWDITETLNRTETRFVPPSRGGSEEGWIEGDGERVGAGRVSEAGVT